MGIITCLYLFICPRASGICKFLVGLTPFYSLNYVIRILFTDEISAIITILDM